VHGDSRRIRYEALREAFYADYVANDRRSLRRDKDKQPRMDKIVRLDDFFEGYRISEIDAATIRKFIVDQQGRGLSNGSINRSITALRRMFYLAKEDDKIRDIPHFPMVKEATPRKGFFERDEYENLLKNLPSYLRLPFAIGYFSGMREGEILGLKWEQKDPKTGLRWKQVDFLDGVIRLAADETKGDEAREIPIIPQLRILLMEEYAKRQPSCPYVCYRLDRKGHALRVKGFRKAWYSSCVAAKLGTMQPKTDVTGEQLYAKPRGKHSKPKVKMVYRGKIFHDLRRTGVRNLVRAGVPEKVAMAISGHKTRSVFERYNIGSGKDVAQAGRQLEVFHNQVGQNLGDKTGTTLPQNAATDSPIN
jgi:integrase